MPILGGVVPLAIDVNSPDINGDLKVNLSNLVEWTAIYHQRSSSFEGDFNFDRQINLTNLVYLARACGQACPGS